MSNEKTPHEEKCLNCYGNGHVDGKQCILCNGAGYFITIPKHSPTPLSAEEFIKEKKLIGPNNFLFTSSDGKNYSLSELMNEQTAQLRQQVEELTKTSNRLFAEKQDQAKTIIEQRERNEKMEKVISESTLESIDLTGRLNKTKEDVTHLQVLVDNKNAYIETLEQMMKSVAFECYKQAVIDMTKPGDVYFEDGVSADFQDVYDDALAKQSLNNK